MADMETALRARLLAAAPVTALVAQRVTWVQRPQAAALPAITLQIVSDERAQSFTGFDGLQPGYVQIDVWAADIEGKPGAPARSGYMLAKAVKEAVIAALVPAATQSGVRFDRGYVSAQDLSEQTETAFIYRQSIDFTFHYAPA